MANFRNFIEFTLKHEGSTYTNHPNDAGGPTKWGIALNTGARNKNAEKYYDVNKDGKIDATDIKNMPKENAIMIYYHAYWDTWPVFNLIRSDRVAYVLFDCMINNGAGNACKIAQRTVNAMGHNIAIDGKYGPATQRAILQASEKNPDKFCDIFLNKRQEFFNAIVANKPSQKVFLKGWTNRINNIRNDIKKLSNN